MGHIFRLLLDRFFALQLAKSFILVFYLQIGVNLEIWRFRVIIYVLFVCVKNCLLIDSSYFLVISNE